MKPSFKTTPLIAAVLVAAAASAGCQNPLSGMITYGDRYRERGIDRYEAGDFLEAKGAFNEAVEQKPDDARNHLWLAESQLALGRPDAAISSLKTAMRVRRLTGEGRADLETRDRIADTLGRAIAASPSGSSKLAELEDTAYASQNPDLFYAVANAHRDRGDADNAIDAYANAIAYAPDDGQISKEYGLYLLELEQETLAEPVLIRAYDADPDDAEVVAGLRQIGVVPGPSLRPRGRLSNPALPKGPIPEFKVRAGFEDNRNKPVDLDAVRARYEDGGEGARDAAVGIDE